MSKTVKVIYDAEKLTTEITVDGQPFDTSRINGKEIADCAYPFMMRKVRWNGFYDEMVKALGGETAFNLVFEGTDEALAELKEAWENAPVTVVSGDGENTVTIIYDENTLTTEITVNGQPFDTSRINGREIADWVYPFMMRKVKWDGIFDELATVVGSEEYTIQFSGSNAAMKKLMEECPDKVEICKAKGGKSNKPQQAASGFVPNDADFDDEIENILKIWDNIETATEQQKKNAFDNLHRIAEQGNPKAQNELGGFYRHGIGTAKDEKKGFEYTKCSAEQGYADGIDSLGECFELGIGVDADDDVAYEHYQKAADLGYWGGFLHMAEWYQQWYFHEEWLEKRGISDDDSEKKAVLLYEKALEIVLNENAPFPIYRIAHALGNYYYDGDYVKQDIRKAVRYFGMALDSGFDKAYERFLDSAISLWEGDEATGIEPNKRKAIQHWKVAAEKGNACAQSNLGYCYYYGDGAYKNYNEALKWYMKAADQDHDHACTMVGIIYYNGYVSQNYREAVRYFEKASELNSENRIAYYFLGLCYLSGKGIQKDKNKGLECMQIASNLGDEDATKLLNDKKLWSKINTGVDIALDLVSYIPGASTIATIAKMIKGGAEQIMD